MLRNYLKTALRTLWRNRTYALLNMGGLAVGVTCAALILLWVEHEVTFDHHHQKRDNLYLTYNWQTYDATTYAFNATPGPMAKALREEIPGVANAARVYWPASTLFSVGEKALSQRGNYVDPAFFEMFTIPFVAGDPKRAFPDLNSVVISQEMAQRFFGDESPLGKTFRVNHKENYTVTGVLATQPITSSFRYDWLLPFAAYEKNNPWLLQWGNNGVMTYVELHPGVAVEQVNRQVLGLLKTKGDDIKSTSFLYPFNRLHLYGNFTNGQPDGGRIEYVWMFSLIAGFILLIACINFMNLATARSEKRAREVGMRKVLGGTQRMIVSQFLGESVLMAYLAVGFAVGLTLLALPAFNQLVEKELTLDVLRPAHLGALALIGLLTGLLAGSYPAFYLASFKPGTVLKGLLRRTDAGASFVRKGLVVFQFVVSVVLIIGTVIVYQQVRYVKARQLGYDKEQLIYLSLDADRAKAFSAIRNELLATGAVTNAAMSWFSVLGLYSNGGGIEWPGKAPGTDVLITQESVTPEYVSTIGLRLLHGRNFTGNPGADTTTVLVNETLAKMIKPDGNAVGVVLGRAGEQPYRVVGVVSDFLFNDFYKAPAPVIFYASTTNGSTLTIRLNRQQDVAAALTKVGDAMRRVSPGYPFEYKFVDQDFADTFKSETLIGRLAAVFAGLAILISCLGLFGLAAYTAERRTREIGVRKVLGASVQSIVRLLSRDFLRLVGVACLVAFPLAWWASSRWLDSYAYRTPIHWWVFGAAGGGALLIALVTVSFQAVKAGLANPVKSLRTE